MSESPEPTQEGAKTIADADVADVVQRARRALRSGGLTDFGERAWSLLNTPPQIPIIVVVGEVKRGKSSLVNALLGRPEASPVDVDIATSAFIRFVSVTPSSVAGQATLLYAGGQQRTIDVTELPDWVTAAGCRVTDPTIDELPIGAEVPVAGQFLPSVTIVDTPGIGGLNPNHLRLATTAVSDAAVILMVCDAGAPITASELAFLESVSGEVDSVIVAVTKVDKNFRHWRSIIEENRRLLRQHAPRFAHVPIVGVSSRHAISALRMESGPRRDSDIKISGLPELVTLLNSACSSSNRLAVTNSLRTSRTGLELLAVRLDLQRSAIKGQTSPDELVIERQRLQDLLDERDGGWRDYLSRDLNALQRDAIRVLDHKLDELRAQWRKRLDSAKLEVLHRSPQLFVADMAADLETLVANVSDQFVQSLDKLVAALRLETEVSVDQLHVPVVRGEDPRKRGEGVLDPQMLMMGVVGSSTLGGGLIAGIGITGGLLTLPLTLAIGGAWVAVNIGFRAMRQGRQNLQQWLNSAVIAVNKDISRDIQDKIETVRPVIVNEYRQQLARSIAQLQELVGTAEAAAKTSRAELQDALLEIDARYDNLRQIAVAIDEQLARVVSSP